MKPRRIIQSRSGERFIESDLENWEEQYEAWLSSKKPCPLPRNHPAFLAPEKFGCHYIEEETIETDRD